MTIFTLYIGYSADGTTLHPSEADPEEGFRFDDLEAAQEEAERLAGRPLNWASVNAGSWKAIVGDSRVAEITEGAPAHIVTSVGLLG